MMKCAIALIMTACATAAGAHEMFLKPAAFYVAPNTATKVVLYNGTFVKSENPITRDRMADVSILSSGKVIKPAASQWQDDKVSSHLSWKAGAPGTYALGLSTKPKIIELSADDFDTYLRHDGIEDTLKARQGSKAPRTPVRERYSKHVRSVVQVGDRLTNDHAQPLGYPAEILLQQNPAALKAGSTLSFKAIYNGQPLPNQLVYASYEGHHSHGSGGGHVHAAKLRTDANGMGQVKIDRAGKWYLTLINMREVKDGQADYESNWSTVTFQVR